MVRIILQVFQCTVYFVYVVQSDATCQLDTYNWAFGSARFHACDT